MVRHMPQTGDIPIPIYVPDSFGDISIEVATGTLKDNVLSVEFAVEGVKGQAGMAVQRMLERGVLLGLSFVMLQVEGAPVDPEEQLQEISEGETHE